MRGLHAKQARHTLVECCGMCKCAHASRVLSREGLLYAREKENAQWMHTRSTFVQVWGWWIRIQCSFVRATSKEATRPSPSPLLLLLLLLLLPSRFRHSEERRVDRRRDQQRWGFGLSGTASEAVDIGTTWTSAHAYSALLSGARAVIGFPLLADSVQVSRLQLYAKYPDTPRFTCFGHVCASQWKLRCCAISLPNSLTSATSHRTYHGSIPTQSSPRLLSRSQRKTPKNMASFQTPGSAFSVRWCRSERKSTPLPSGEW